MQPNDYYAVLGIPADATPVQIKAAYRALSKRYHPDLNPGNPLAEEKFKQLQQAYAVLSDAEQRRQYDLRRQGQQTESIYAQAAADTAGETAETETQASNREVYNLARFGFTMVMCVVFFVRMCSSEPDPPEYRVLTTTEITEMEAARKAYEDSLKREEGRVFLYTNYHEATAGWHIGHPSRVRFLEDADDRRVLMVRYNQSYHSFHYVINYNNEAENKQFYFIGYDKDGEMGKDESYGEYTTSEHAKFSTAWVLGVKDSADITATSLSVAHMTGVKLFMKRNKGFKFLMTAVEKDDNRPGVSLEEFQQGIRVVNRLFKKEGIDTTQFQLKVFNAVAQR